jgi:hypothetical protein
MTHVFRLLVAAGVCGQVAALEAQTFASGDRARIVVREAQAQDEAPGRKQLILRGNVTRVSGDTIFLRPVGTTGELGIPTSSALRLHRSLGVRSRPASAFRGAVTFAIVGAATFALTYRRDEMDYDVDSRGQAAALGAGVGAITGLVFGALQPTERWQRIR